MYKLIVSLTTWTPRINVAQNTILSLIMSKNTSPYKNYIEIKLILSEDEFPSMECLPNFYIDAVKNNFIEIIFDKGNMRAHKKILYTAEKYKDYHILVVDDDKYYDSNFLTTYYEDMCKYPNDVLIGRTHFYMLINEKYELYTEIIDKNWSPHEKPGEITYNKKMASGLNGTLFPPYSFNDKRFFDRELINRVCPDSDEDWCWAFIIIKGLTMRFSTHEIREPNTTTTIQCLCNTHGQSEYEKYYPLMCKELNDLIPSYKRYLNKFEKMKNKFS